MWPGADANRGDADGFCYLGRERSRYFLQYHAEATGFFQHFCVRPEFFGLGVFFCPYGIGAEFVDGLGGKAQMPHHGDAGIDDALYRFLDFDTTLHFQSMGAGFLHHAHRSPQGIAAVALVRSEWQIDNYQCTLCSAYHCRCVVHHLFERDGYRGFIAGHHFGGRVAHEDDVAARIVHDARHGIIVPCKHRYFLTTVLHLPDGMGGDAFDFLIYRHNANVVKNGVILYILSGSVAAGSRSGCQDDNQAAQLIFLTSAACGPRWPFTMLNSMRSSSAIGSVRSLTWKKIRSPVIPSLMKP